jgi:hypothetical protein
LEDNKDLYPIEYYVISLLKEKFAANINIDVTMHLLFLGITKSGVRMIQSWCALRVSTNDVTKHVTGVMETFDGIGLSWLI